MTNTSTAGGYLNRVGQFLGKAGDVIGGGAGDFGAKSGEMVGKGIKGLREKKSIPLSFSTGDYVKSGAKAGLTATALAGLAGAVAPKAGMTLAQKKLWAEYMKFKYAKPATEIGGKKFLSESAKAAIKKGFVN